MGWSASFFFFLYFKQLYSIFHYLRNYLICASVWFLRNTLQVTKKSEGLCLPHKIIIFFDFSKRTCITIIRPQFLYQTKLIFISIISSCKIIVFPVKCIFMNNHFQKWLQNTVLSLIFFLFFYFIFDDLTWLNRFFSFECVHLSVNCDQLRTW